MPFILLVGGVLLLVTAYQGTTKQLGAMLKQDVFGGSGTNGLLLWLVVVAVIGGIGYVKPLKGLSDAFLVLVILVLFLSNAGFFANFNAALKQISSGASVTSGAATAGQTPALSSLSSLPGLPSLNQPFGNWLQ